MSPIDRQPLNILEAAVHLGTTLWWYYFVVFQTNARHSILNKRVLKYH